MAAPTLAWCKVALLAPGAPKQRDGRKMPGAQGDILTRVAPLAAAGGPATKADLYSRPGEAASPLEVLPREERFDSGTRTGEATLRLPPMVMRVVSGARTGEDTLDCAAERGADAAPDAACTDHCNMASPRCTCERGCALRAEVKGRP